MVQAPQQGLASNRPYTPESSVVGEEEEQEGKEEAFWCPRQLSEENVSEGPTNEPLAAIEAGQGTELSVAADGGGSPNVEEILA